MNILITTVPDIANSELKNGVVIHVFISNNATNEIQQLNAI